MEKVALGIPCYGQQTPEWWGSLLATVSRFQYYDIEFAGAYTSGTMAVDSNRNAIAGSFVRKSKADWIWWMDADTISPQGAIKRLLATGKKLVSGLYFLKAPPHAPVAYTRNANGNYTPLMGWNRGEIVQADMVGMGCCLMHRSVLEEYERQFRVMERDTGGIMVVHKDDIISTNTLHHKNDGKVVNSVWHIPLRPPTLDLKDFPFFIGEYNRTEDVMFFENVARTGAELWVDTSVECKHEAVRPIVGLDYRHVLYTHQGFYPPTELYGGEEKSEPAEPPKSDGWTGEGQTRP